MILHRYRIAQKFRRRIFLRISWIDRDSRKYSPEYFVLTLYLYIKVAALAHVSKSNPYNFWWRGRVIDLNYVSEVLCRSLLACASYGRKEKVKIATNSKCYLIN